MVSVLSTPNFGNVGGSGHLTIGPLIFEIYYESSNLSVILNTSILITLLLVTIFKHTK